MATCRFSQFADRLESDPERNAERGRETDDTRIQISAWRDASICKFAGLTRNEFTMGKSKEQPCFQNKPWYRNANNWAWIILGILVLTIILMIIDEGRQVRKARENPVQRPSWKEVLTPEEQHSWGLDRPFEDPDWTPPADVKERVRKFLEEGGAKDEILDKLDEVDFYDLLDQFGDYDGF